MVAFSKRRLPSLGIAPPSGRCHRQVTSINMSYDFLVLHRLTHNCRDFILGSISIHILKTYPTF
jgi:hypothetical protein